MQEGKEEDAYAVLLEFNRKNSQTFTFPEFTKDTKKVAVECLTQRLSGPGSPTTHRACLEMIRILSRDKTHLEVLTSEHTMNSLVHHTGLEMYAQQHSDSVTIQEGDYTVMVEAQKCLCNLIFNSQVAQRVCCTNGCIEGIVQRLKTYKDPDLSHDIKFFDMRVLFLLTALCPDIRPRLCWELHGFTYLIEVLDLCLEDNVDPSTALGAARRTDTSPPLTDQHVELCCEVLKILFNLTVSIDKSSLDEEEEAHFMRLVSVLYELLTAVTASKDKKEELVSHTVNLLTNLPRESYEELVTPLNEGSLDSPTDPNDVGQQQVEYDGNNMAAVVVLIDFLNKRLDVPKASLKEGVTPILHCLCEVCRSNRSIRKFCRIRVLPYLRDEVKQLPEEGQTLRNKLCKLFTNPVTQVKDLAADFLFVLCKESVARFVKYTGYGNASGLLAQRGLMCGGQGAEYSSESEDSETEVYAELKDNINPVTGRYEVPKPSPMEGMSEEQKEYEAMKLVEKLHKLQSRGIIQPSTIGEDGRPVPVEHVLQLTENIPDSAADAHDSD